MQNQLKGESNVEEFIFLSTCGSINKTNFISLEIVKSNRSVASVENFYYEYLHSEVRL